MALLAIHALGTSVYMPVDFFKAVKCSVWGYIAQQTLLYPCHLVQQKFQISYLIGSILYWTCHGHMAYMHVCCLGHRGWNCSLLVQS